MNCPQCQNQTGYREWIDNRQDAKTYGRVFRRDKCEACGWESKAQLTDKPSQVIPKQQPKQQPRPTVSNDKQDMRSFAMAYAKDIVVALINTKTEVDKPATKTIKLFRLIYKEMSDPFSLKLKEEPEIHPIDFNEAI